MAGNPPLPKELRVMLATERQALRRLSQAYTEISRDLTRWANVKGPGAQVRRGQLRTLQRAIALQLADMWEQVGNDIRAGRLRAAVAATEPTAEVLAYFRAAGLTPIELERMKRATAAAAEQTVVTAMQRIQGRSYIPLSDRVWSTQALVNGQLDKIIDLALLKGINNRDLAKAVRGYVNPRTPGGVRYAVQRLARTEINNAFHAASVAEMQVEPFTEAIQWHLSGSHPKPDECNDYAEKTHVKGGDPGVYRKGDVPRRPHPNCLCYTTGVTMERDEFISAFQRGQFDDWLRGHGVDPG